MKKNIFSILFATTCILLVFYTNKEPEPTPTFLSSTPFRVIANFDTTVISSNTLFTAISSIKHKEITDIMDIQGVTTLRAIFRNRYSNNGFLKKDVYSDCKHLLLNGWYELLIDDLGKAKELVEALNGKLGYWKFILSIHLK